MSITNLWKSKIGRMSKFLLVFGAIFIAFQFGPNDITTSDIVNIVKIQKARAAAFFGTFSTAALK